MVAQAVRQLEVKYDGMKPLNLKDPMKTKLSLLANGILGPSEDYKTKIDIINEKIKRYEQKIVEQERINKLSNPSMKSVPAINNQPPFAPHTQMPVPVNVNQTQLRSAPISNVFVPQSAGQPQNLVETPPKPVEMRAQPKLEGRPRVGPKMEPQSAGGHIPKVERTPKVEPRHPEQLQGAHLGQPPQSFVGQRPPLNQQRPPIGQQRQPILQNQAPIVGLDIPPPPPPIMRPNSNPHHPNHQYQPRSNFMGRFQAPRVPTKNFTLPSVANSRPTLRLPPDDLGIVAPAFRNRTEKIGTLSHRADAPVEQASIKPKIPH